MFWSSAGATFLLIASFVKTGGKLVDRKKELNRWVWWGLDVGKKYIGVARANRDHGLAFPYTIIHLKQGASASYAAHFVYQQLHDQWKGAHCVVVGEPLLFSGEEGTMARWVRSFSSVLEKKLIQACENGSVDPYHGCKVVLWDECFSTEEAQKRVQMFARKRKGKEHRTRCDDQSAACILQSYLDHGVGETDLFSSPGCPYQ